MNGSFERRRRENVFRDSYDAAAETQRESKAQRGGRVTSFRALVLCSKYDVIP